jgi:hypothetical protein
MSCSDLLRGRTPLGQLFLTLPKQLSPKGVRWDMTNQGPQNFKPTDSLVIKQYKRTGEPDVPLVLLLVSVSKEHDFFSSWEDEPERTLDTVHGRLVAVIAMICIIFERNSLLQIDRGGGLFGHVVEGNEIATNYAELSTTPRLEGLDEFTLAQ